MKLVLDYDNKDDILFDQKLKARVVSLNRRALKTHINPPTPTHWKMENTHYIS